jgi:oligoendopeptidase F
MINPKVSKRADVPLEQTWNRESVFASWDEFTTEYDAIANRIPELAAFKGKLGESPDRLVQWLDLFFPLRQQVGKLQVYTQMSVFVDNSDTQAKSKQGQVASLMAEIAGASAFAEPELVDIGGKLLDWSQQDSRLAIYKHYFEDLLRQQEYIQSPEVERLLGMVQDAFSGPFKTYLEMTNTDLTFPNAIDGQGIEHRVMQAIPTPSGIGSPDRILRKNAWENFCDGHKAFENTLTNNLITQFKQNVFLARAQGYTSVLEAKLMPSNMPVDVFHNLVNTCRANLSVWHRYWDAKRKILGLEQIHPYDMLASTTQNPPTIRYETAIDWLVTSLEPLGEEYTDVLYRGATIDRWVDYASNEGRGQGAFSNPAYDCHPFIFNTFQGSMTEMSVLAHELGHSMHHYWTNKHQPNVYNGGLAKGKSSSVSETASNFHQVMLRAYLLKQNNHDRDFQLALIDEAMMNFHRYFFVMPILSQFEYEVYTMVENTEPVNARILNELTGRLFSEGFGETMTDDPERTETIWMQFLHLYIGYYPFQYGVGISAAHAFGTAILEGKDSMVERYLNFIGAGWSAYAPQLFEIGGVDMTKPEPIEQTFVVLEQLVQRMESLIQ